MKKIFSLFLVISLIFTITSCGKTESGDSKTDSINIKSSSQDSKEETKDSENNKVSDSKKVLVAYFSATGNTKNVANYITKATNAEVFEIIPKEKYTDDDLDWTNDKSRVGVEHKDESNRNIELEAITPENWEDYDTIFIGYPIWWGIAAWPINNFIKGNNFDGKTIIPFCTSSSSELGESGDLLKDMAGTGNWLEGKRFSSSVIENEVNDWVKDLGIN